MYSKKTSFFNMFHVYCFCVKCTWWFFLIIIHFGMYFIYDRFFVSVQYQIYLSLLVTVLGFWNRYIIYVRNFAFQWILYVQCDSFLIQVFERLFYFDTVYILHDLRTSWKNRCFILHSFMDVGYFEFDSLVFSRHRLCAFQNFKCKF